MMRSSHLSPHDTAKLSTTLPERLLQASRLVADGKMAKAEPILRGYVHDNPADVNGIRLLAEVGLSLGALRDSEMLFKRAVELAPDYHAARYGYATVLYKRHQYSLSIKELDVLLEIDPNNPGWLTLKAANLVEINEHLAALPLFESIICHQSDFRQAYLSYGHALRALGRVDDCINAYETATTISDGAGEAFWSLANLKTYRFDDLQIEQMESKLQDTQCLYRDYYHLLFALGKAKEDRKDYAAAMAAYVKGNQVRARSVPWDKKRFHADTEELISFFSADRLATLSSRACPSDAPIFVVGLPRSGSTLIEQILSSHSEVEGTAELADIIALARKISGKSRRNDVSQYPGALANMSAADFERMGQSYIDSTAIQRVSGKPRFIDKMPNNFSHIGLIHLILPNAKIIDARRHPLDCCFSGYKQLFASGQGFSYGMDRIGHYYRDYLSMMDHWDQVLPGKVLRVQYEDMVADTEHQVRRILNFCELEFQSACLSFYQTKRTVRTASSEQVRQPIYREGIQQWKPFDQWLDPLRAALGDALTRYPDTLGTTDMSESADI